MLFPAMKPSRTVHASSEQEAVDAAMLLVRDELLASYGDEALEVELEPLLVVELEPGLWDVVVDVAREMACGAHITFT